jgi:SSS family solute:Na+ symporter
MNFTLFIVLLFCLQFFYWFVGRNASKNLKDEEDYFLAGKSIRLFPLMMTFLATQVGGGVILGAAEEAYLFGWPVLLYPMGAALGLILLGCGMGKRLAAFQVSTIAEVFEAFYGSQALRKIASFLSVVSLFMVLVAQIIASHKFLISMGISSTFLFIAFWAIVIVYTSQGGLKAVVSADMVQAAFFLGVFFSCFLFVFFYEPSFSTLALPTTEEFTNVSSKLTGWLLMPMLFMLIEQDMGQRCFAGASPQIISRASLLAGLGTMAVCVIPVCFGLFAKASDLQIPQGGSVLMSAISAATNPWLTAFVACAVLAAVVSTATSLINAIGSNLSNDFNIDYFDNINPLLLAKWMTSLVSIMAIFFAFYFDSIVDILIQSYELSISCLFVPIFFALFKRKGCFMAACFSIAFGGGAFIIFRFYPLEFPREVAAILVSLLGYAVGELLENYAAKTKEQTVRECL